MRLSCLIGELRLGWGRPLIVSSSPIVLRSLLPTFLGFFVSIVLIGNAHALGDNVLLIVADDLGVDMVGVYGEGPDPPSTPTIDQLASEGVLFRNAWANPTCSPTRAEMQTGRYGFRTGIGLVITYLGWSMEQDEVTFAEVLNRNPDLGYTTGLIGKWHLSNFNNGYLDGPLLQGYDRFTGSRENIRAGYRFDKWLRVEDGVESLCTTYATVQQVDDAIDFIRSAPEPWVCVLNFNAPHEPFHRPPQDLFQRVLPPGDPRLDPPPFYKAAVESVDHELERMMTLLAPFRDRTNIILTADNGTPKLASEPPFKPSHAKLTPYEGGLNVPLIVNGPIVNSPGREVLALVAMTDMFSSVLELCGVNDPAVIAPGMGHDSQSFVPYLKFPNQVPLRDHVYAEMFSPNGPAGLLADNDARAIRGLRYKIVRRGTIGGPYSWEFYDLDLDPFEDSNLLTAGPVTPDQVTAFMELYQALQLLIN